MKNLVSVNARMLKSASELGRTLGMATVCVALVGCASLQPKSPEDAVKHRAGQRWAAMLVKDFKAAYKYLSPFKRATVSAPTYVREMGDGSPWLAAEVVSVSCEPQTCKATVRLDVASPMPRKFGDKIITHIDETWVLVDGEWWYSER